MASTTLFYIETGALSTLFIRLSSHLPSLKKNQIPQGFDNRIRHLLQFPPAA